MVAPSREHPPSDRAVSQFWKWFASIAERLSDDFENEAFLAELDRRLSALADVGWELGPGRTSANALAISPNGEADLLPVTRKIAAAAPAGLGWEVHPARPARDPYLTFSMRRPGDAAEIEVDARAWRYVLYRFREGDFDVVLEQPNLGSLSDDERYSAAVIFLDGALGEEARLRRVREVEAVVALSAEQAAKASQASDLRAHLAALGTEEDAS